MVDQLSGSCHGLENIGVFNDDGNVIDGVVITFVDISVAKKLEVELRAAKGVGSST